MKDTIKVIIVIVSLPIVAIGFMASFSRAFFLAGRDYAEDFTDWLDRK